MLMLLTEKTMKRQQPPPTAVLFPLFLVIFLLTTASVQSRTLQELCSSSCGDITEISYPFRLKTDPVTCGDPSYELSCDDGKPMLEFHSGKYYVKRISYEKRIIRVVDINLANGSCSLPYKSLSANDLMTDSLYRGRVSNVDTSFIKCSRNMSDPSYRLVPCLSGDGSYVYVSYGTYIISDLKGPCSFISRVPTIYQAVMQPSYESILQLMQSGFDLGWSPECQICTNVGASCSISSLDTTYSLKCYYNGVYVPTMIVSIISAIWIILFGINLIARFILAPIVITGLLVHKYRTEKKTLDNKETLVLNQQSLIPRRFSYSGIIAITSHFKEKLGQGGFGTVYKGQLPDGSIVSVKMIGNSKFSDEDFINEILTIGRIQHVNVVRLLGFCSEGTHHALVYEYMPNGSLDKYIYSRGVQFQPFSWEKLLQIALGTARGIEHLHVGREVCILHFDIKPHNILLDHNFIPKVSDFGLAKVYPKDHDFVSISAARGTIGFIAPELISKNLEAVSSKSDVYSFGMLLLEMAGRRRNVDANGSCSSEEYFPSWVYDHLKQGGDLELKNVTEVEAAIARKLCVVALWCIQKDPSARPTMTEVVNMLEGSMNDLQLPPNALSFPEHVSNKGLESDSSTELLISEIEQQNL